MRGLGHMPSVCGVGSNASGSNPSVQAARSCQACAGLVHVRENSVLSFKWMIMCVYCSTLEGVCACACPVDTLRFNLITAGVMERKRGAAATDGLNRMEG